jgi:hypothetical protein
MKIKLLMNIAGEIMELFDRSSSRNVRAIDDDLFRLRIISFDETAEIVFEDSFCEI